MFIPVTKLNKNVATLQGFNFTVLLAVTAIIGEVNALAS